MWQQELTWFFDTVAAILYSIWTGQSIAFILPLPPFFLREIIM